MRIQPRLLLTICILLATRCVAADAQSHEQPPTANHIDTYRVRWWGAPGSEFDRPIYQILRIENGPLEVRHAVLPGRELGDYRLPYWPIRSFVSIIRRPAELPHRGYVEYLAKDKKKTMPLVVNGGFELATLGGADILKVTNHKSHWPFLMEHYFVVEKNSPAVQVVARVTNSTKETIKGVVPLAQYAQDFNWSNFGALREGKSASAEKPDKGTASGFFAFSSGMKRGYEFLPGDNCTLSCRITEPLKVWEVTMRGASADLAPGESTCFRYVVRATDGMPEEKQQTAIIPTERLLALPYRKIEAGEFKPAPIASEGRVMLPQVVEGLKKPKVRGLNLRGSGSQALEDLKTLKEWGCNLVITRAGKPESTGKLIEAGHELGMEMFVSGSGSFHDGAPKFDQYYSKPLPLERQADSHGQDEDHYYWFDIEPTRDFQADFGKPPGAATVEEKVRYYSRCFCDKWRGVLEDVRKHAPSGGIWFYAPSPGMANVDPLDYYDIFFREIAGLGKPLTVFPFYYGIDFTQPEYMMRRWKDAGVDRAIFLPMRGFVSKPSQFIRAITAARRGQADGTCGFSFGVSSAKPHEVWQWKAVMLGEWANFPTPELDAYCFIEEPAELIEALAEDEIRVVPDMKARSAEVEEFRERLGELLPNSTRLCLATRPTSSEETLNVILGTAALPEGDKWPYSLNKKTDGPGKGLIQMRGKTVLLSGTDAAGLKAAKKLFLRFAELAKAESEGEPEVWAAGWHVPEPPAMGVANHAALPHALHFSGRATVPR